MKYATLLPCCALALLLFGGCSDRTEPVIPVDRQEISPPSGFASYEAALRAQAFPDGSATLDDLFRAAATVEPWFGGMYIAGGQLRMVTTEPTVTGTRAAGLAMGLLETVGKRGMAHALTEVALVRGQFSFKDLWEWRVALSSRFKDFDVRFVDIDEVNNVLDLRVASAGQVQGLRDWVVDNHIPPKAVRVSVFNQPELNHYDYGGDDVLVEWGPTSFHGCTLTQAVEHHLADASPDSIIYGITNSHCTATFGSYDGNYLVESDQSTIVGFEYWDAPKFSDARCQTFRGDSVAFCRYSDAALFNFSSSATAGLNPHMVRPALDSLDGEETHLLTGDTVHMYGAASGQQDGRVYQTCVDLQEWRSGTHIADLLCQYTASYGAANGDSGGPVWTLETLGGITSTLFSGIHWGHQNDTSYFSGALKLGQEIQPDKAGWEGNICLSFDSQFCWY